MKKNIFYLLLLFLPQVCLCQFLIPKHSTKIYFTDAKGNKDTLQFGLTPNTDPTGWDVLYGEIDLMNKAFNAILDTRFLYGSGNVKTTIRNSKGDCDGPSYLLKQERNRIGFHAKYLPVTMRWDTNFLHEICVPYQYMTRDLVIDGLSEKTTIQMHKQDSFVIDRKYLDIKIDQQPSSKYFITTTTEGKKDTVHFLYMTYSKEKDLVANNDISNNYALKIAPNPVEDILIFELDDTWITQQATTTITIVGIDGKRYIQKMEESNQGNKYSVNTENLPNGMYFLKIENSNGRFVQTKFVKE
ncbi:MAG: Secretion system C-terminal sorting domain [Bacteroidota bacterium]|jgi:hypothetical protein